MQLVSISELPSSALMTDFPTSAASPALSQMLIPKGHSPHPPSRPAGFVPSAAKQFTRETMPGLSTPFLSLREAPSQTLLTALQKGTNREGRHTCHSRGREKGCGWRICSDCKPWEYPLDQVMSTGLTRVAWVQRVLSDPPGPREGRLGLQNMSH